MNRIFLFFTLILTSNLTAMDKSDKVTSQKNPVIGEIKLLSAFVSDTINNKTKISFNDLRKQIELTGQKEIEQSINNQTKNTVQHIENLIQSNKTYIDLPDSLKRTPLMLATIHMQSSIVKLLLKHNAPTNSTDLLGKTAMDYARETFKKSIKMIEARTRKAEVGLEYSGYHLDGTPLFGCKEFIFRNKDIEICLQLIHEKNQQPIKDLLSD